MNEQLHENILNSFREFVDRFIQTDNKLFNTIIDNFEDKKVARKEHLFEAGMIAKKNFFYLISTVSIKIFLLINFEILNTKVGNIFAQPF